MGALFSKNLRKAYEKEAIQTFDEALNSGKKFLSSFQNGMKNMCDPFDSYVFARASSSTASKAGGAPKPKVNDFLHFFKANSSNLGKKNGGELNLKFENADYHTKISNPVKSKTPANPEIALKNSIQITENSSRRIGVDSKSGEFVLFDQTHPEKDLFHGHVRTWEQLEQQHKNILMKYFGLKNNGKIKKR